MTGSRDPIRDYIRWRRHEDRVTAAYRWLAVALVAASVIAAGVALWLFVSLTLAVLG